jgi:cell wall-associated NlpC family hydrolase
MHRATLRARFGATAAAVTFVTISLISAVPATALTHARTASVAPHSATHHTVAARRRARRLAAVRHRNKLVREVIAEARRQRGKPYSYGADGPHAFDCSGLVRYVFQHSVHRTLPHNAAAQYHSLRHISRRSLSVGDLVFTDNGYISHVGIFAGHHHWWVAPHTGTRVQLQRIYRAHFVYARVLRYPR